MCISSSVLLNGRDYFYNEQVVIFKGTVYWYGSRGIAHYFKSLLYVHLQDFMRQKTNND